MTEERPIDRAAGRCVKTGRPLAEGEAYYAVLFEQGDNFRREEYAVEAWSGPPPGAYCYFKARIPIKEKKRKPLVDNEVLIDFFVRLADETVPVRVQFRFVLALLLMRKRLLKYETTNRTEAAETWIMRLVKDQSMHAVQNPRMTDEQITAVSQELGAVLHAGPDDVPFAESLETTADALGGAPA